MRTQQTIGTVHWVSVMAGVAITLTGCMGIARTPSASPQPTQTPWVITATPPPAARLGAEAVGSDWENLYVQLYEQSSPSVVHITTQTRVWSFFRGVDVQAGSGSGFIYDDEGHIVTNNHVIEGAERVEVIFADGATLPATVIGSDAYNDLAVLRVEGARPEQIRPLPLGESSTLKVGMRVAAIGNPFGLDRTLTTGVISALGRTIEREDAAALGEMIQTDAAINPGNSGGPLLNLRGEVIGVNTIIRSPSGGSVGIGFAVPVDTVKRVVPELIRHGRYEHPWLGFNAYEITPALAEFLKLPVKKGLLIAQLQAGGPADLAGVRGASQRLRTTVGTLLVGGDILIALDDRPIHTRDDMTIYLENHKRVGDTVRLTLIRDGEQITLEATLQARP
ncbi:MAG: trypsin-like peptidase domain-containing protein [Anaerolineae bacterium]|nr:trypsin-like peptidase domain-containing protein [Thermoflexales bacterium]MDW8408688.1 trypsin-like peptidase domain-containing protein [Anaerolineae bacterium]